MRGKAAVRIVISAVLAGVLGCGCDVFESRAAGPGGGGERKKVVIVTGIDHPAHNWRQTAPALAEVLGGDVRLSVDVVREPEFLASGSLFDYDVVVVHFMEWERPSCGPAARRNLQRFVADGGGLFVLHFGCGAFRDWPEYRQLAGRVWDPNLRPHDPRGPFRVDIVNTSHPVTCGLRSFETDDELYTCLAGDRPVEILATARSKVDKKVYPIAFVHKYGRGRVFHCSLGHDVRAITHRPVAELLRRGCAWVARLEPAAERGCTAGRGGSETGEQEGQP